MAARLPAGRHSFRFQLTLLGSAVVVLFVAVLIASLAALQYTKSAVLNGEKHRLITASNELARYFRDHAGAAGSETASASAAPSDAPAPEDLAAMARVIFQKFDGTGAGFFRRGANSAVGYFPDSASPKSRGAEIPDDLRPVILDAAAEAAKSGQIAERQVNAGGDVVLVEASPIRLGSVVWGSAWTVERLQSIPGSNRLRAYLVTVGLGIAALLCVILTFLVVRDLQAGVRKIESGLQGLESDLSSQIPAQSDPEEIQRIAQAINRLGATLKQNIEREKLIEDRLRHAERLAALGRLVAGVAHEVRNPLATIRLRLQMAQREARSPRVDESCAVALEEIERLNGMVNRLLNFARPIHLQPESTNLIELAEQRLSRFQDNAQKSGIQIITDFPEDGTWVALDRSKMAQVFDNVIQNAIEAMTQSGGTLWVSVTSTVRSAGGTDKVRVEFRDTGNGISSNSISRIFDPFFTTKPSGTGLGLSICHEFVRAHGGEIQVESAEGDGTRVRIVLPVNEDVPDDVPVS